MGKERATGEEEEKNPRFQAEVGQMVFERAADADDLSSLEHAEQADEAEWG